jgi:hypothetical protein
MFTPTTRSLVENHQFEWKARDSHQIWTMKSSIAFEKVNFTIIPVNYPLILRGIVNTSCLFAILTASNADKFEPANAFLLEGP